MIFIEMYVWLSLAFDRFICALIALYVLVPAGTIYLIICVIYFAHKCSLIADLY